MKSSSIMLLIALLFLTQSAVLSIDKKPWTGLPDIPKIAFKSRVTLQNRIAKDDLRSHDRVLDLSRGGDGQDRYYDSYDGGRYDYDREQRDYNDDYYYEDNRDRRPQQYDKREDKSMLSSAFSDKLPSQRKLGTGCIAAGSVLMLLGVSLFFNKTLLRFGNILLLIGVPLMFGPSKTMGYFLQPAKARATACLVVGIILVVLLGRPILGIAMQVFGLLNLFGNMFPMVRLLLSQMPVVGDLFKPGDKNKSRTRREYYDSGRDSGYYEADNYEESYY